MCLTTVIFKTCHTRVSSMTFFKNLHGIEYFLTHPCSSSSLTHSSFEHKCLLCSCFLCCFPWIAYAIIIMLSCPCHHIWEVFTISTTPETTTNPSTYPLTRLKWHWFLFWHYKRSYCLLLRECGHHKNIDVGQKVHCEYICPSWIVDLWETWSRVTYVTRLLQTE